nr:hypothetical protein [Polycyclovorans algicola]
MTSPLENLCGTGKPLAAEPPDAREFAGLQRSGQARLNDADAAGLAIESRFDLAYNAAHALSLAALRHAGFRAQHRYIVFQVLPHTLKLGPEVWLTLPPKSVSLAEWFNSSKENGNDEDDEGALHARIQARGGAAGRGWPEHCGGGQDLGCG